MSGNGEYKPRFANTAEEFVFYTDTDKEDYPIYLLPSREIIYKHRPEAERYAVFHVKHVKEIKGTWLYRDYLDEILAAFSSLPLKEIVEAVRSVVGEYDFHVYHRVVVYEVYRGDYEESLGEYEVPYVLFVVYPHYSKYAPEKQQFAVTYSTLKRLVSKLPENIRAYVEKRAYVTKTHIKKVGDVPVIRIKLPAPTPEFERLFNDVVAWLTAPEPELPAEDAEDVEDQEERPLPVEEILAKPQELEVEFEQPPAPAVTAATSQLQPAAPSRAELVKIYLLSMRLPSKYLVQSVEYSASKTSVREVRFWAGEAAKKASRLESIRREVYAKVSRIFCFVEEFGTWIAVTEQAVEEAKKVSAFVVEELKKLGIDDTSRYAVKIIQVYLQPEDARELLGAAVRSLSKDVEALAEKIKEAEREQDKRALRRLEKERSYREALLTALRNYLASLEG
jgi:hypothetical protein